MDREVQPAGRCLEQRARRACNACPRARLRTDNGGEPCESRVIEVAGRDALLVKRFDRERTAAGYLRARMISVLTLLRTDDTYQSRDKWSYVLLAEEVRRVCAEPGQTPPNCSGACTSTR